jgi:hypothetical protein
MLVKAELEKLNLHYTSVELGFVIILKVWMKQQEKHLAKTCYNRG